MQLLKVLSGVVLMCVFFACKKQSQTLPFSPVENYYPLQPGKYFIYRLDSTLYLSFGSVAKVKSYLAKDSIIATFTDNNGRTSYSIYRYTTDTLQQAPWQYKSTYFVTPAAHSIEVVDDNNYRFIKLTEPTAEGHSWKGNAYLDTKSISSSIQYLNDWDYTYQNVDAPFTTISGTLDSTVTVMQQDFASHPGGFDPTIFQQRDYSIEVYTKGVGLVYKDFLHWVWQTDPPPAHYEDGSYGIRLNLISHN